MLQKIVSHVSMQENHINIVRINTYHQKLYIELMGENVFLNLAGIRFLVPQGGSGFYWISDQHLKFFQNI